jgi:hypothetical protein
MDLHALANHVDFTNPVSWLALSGFLLGVFNTALTLFRNARDRGRLRVAAVVQGRQRCPGEEVAEEGDFVTLTVANEGTRPVWLRHVCGLRLEDGIRLPFEIHQQPRKDWRVDPGEMRTVPVLDASALDGSVRWLGAGDHLGHVWKLSRRRLARLVRAEKKARRAAFRQQPNLFPPR